MRQSRLRSFWLFIGLISISLSLRADPPKRHRRGTPSPTPTAAQSIESSLHPYSSDASGSKTASSTAEEDDASAPTSVVNCGVKKTVEEYLRIPAAYRPQGSVDGGVYFLSDLKGKPQVFYQATAKSVPEQRSFFVEGVVDFRLSPDGKKLLVNTQSGLYLLERNGKMQETRIAAGTASSLAAAWSPNSAQFFYTSNTRRPGDFDLYRYETTPHHADLVKTLDGRTSVTDVSPDGRLVALAAFHSAADSDVWIWDGTTHEISNLTKHRGDARFFGGRFTGDSHGVFLLGNDPAGAPQLFLYRYPDREPPRTLPVGKRGAKDFEISLSRRSLAYVVDEENTANIDGLEIEKNGLPQRSLTVPRPSPSYRRSPGFSASREPGFFFSQSSATVASGIWLWKSPHATRWTPAAMGEVHAECLATEKFVHYPTADGSQAAFLYYPPRAAGPVPFILYAGGAGEAKRPPSFDGLIQYFVADGFGVLELPDTAQATDFVKGAAWLIAEHYAAPLRLAMLAGRSDLAGVANTVVAELKKRKIEAEARELPDPSGPATEATKSLAYFLERYLGEKKGP